MTAEQQLERSVLESKERDELHAIAQALSVKTNTRTKKADIIDGILKATGVAVDGVPSDAPAARAPRGGRSRPVTTDNGSADEAPAANGDHADPAGTAGAVPQAGRAVVRPGRRRRRHRCVGRARLRLRRHSRSRPRPTERRCRTTSRRHRRRRRERRPLGPERRRPDPPEQPGRRPGQQPEPGQRNNRNNQNNQQPGQPEPGRDQGNNQGNNQGNRNNQGNQGNRNNQGSQGGGNDDVGNRRSNRRRRGRERQGGPEGDLQGGGNQEQQYQGELIPVARPARSSR